ncbi:MAG: hypothetical protein ABUT20_14565 [Bacteroidota bacterium]
MKRLSIFCLLVLFSIHSTAQLKEIFYEDFSSNKNNWSVGEIENLSAKIDNGKYIVDNSRPQSINLRKVIGVDTSKNFEIGVNVKPILVHGSSFGGLFFGCNSEKAFGFVINTNGEYGLFEQQGQGLKVIIPITKSEYLKKGVNVTNSLKLKKTGKKWNLFINDSLINSVPSTKFYGPYIGVYTENMKAEYDDLKVSGTAITTSGNFCTLFPLIFQSAKNNFEYIKGEPADMDDTTSFKLSTRLQEDENAEIFYNITPAFLYAILKDDNISIAEAIKYNDNLVLQMKKCMPGFVFTKAKNKEGQPQYTITEKASSLATQPKVVLGISKSTFFTTLDIYSVPVKKIEPVVVVKPVQKVIVPEVKKPTSGWIINDDFRDNRNGWLVDSANANFATYFRKEMFKQNNEYFLDNKNKKNGYSMSIDNVIYNEKDNYKIEVEINDYTGDDNKGNGIIFGCDKTAKNYFRFLITQTGSFRIDRITENGDSVIQEWKKSNVIFSNNKLGVISKGKMWTFYINDQQVYFGYTQPLFGNGAGIYISPECAVFCKLFRSYDWTVAAKIPNEPKEPVYTNILNDVFKSNENNWSTINDADVTASVKDFGYQIENKYDGIYMPVYQARMTTVQDHIAETRVMHIKGSDYSGFGLSFGKKDVNNAYVFMINNTGRFRVGYYENGNWKDLKEWTENKIIESTMASGKISANSLRFENILGEWRFYINDSLVYNCPARSLDGGGIGFFADSKQTVQYQFIKINMVSFPAE